jgi:hypothetical protein
MLTLKVYLEKKFGIQDALGGELFQGNKKYI